jgi:hypothetical protein
VRACECAVAVAWHACRLLARLAPCCSWRADARQRWPGSKPALVGSRHQGRYLRTVRYAARRGLHRQAPRARRPRAPLTDRAACDVRVTGFLAGRTASTHWDVLSHSKTQYPTHSVPRGTPNRKQKEVGVEIDNGSCQTNSGSCEMQVVLDIRDEMALAAGTWAHVPAPPRSNSRVFKPTKMKGAHEDSERVPKQYECMVRTFPAPCNKQRPSVAAD